MSAISGEGTFSIKNKRRRDGIVAILPLLKDRHRNSRQKLIEKRGSSQLSAILAPEAGFRGRCTPTNMNQLLKSISTPSVIGCRPMIRAACGRRTSTAESRYNNISYWELSAPKLNFGRIYNRERDGVFDNLSNIVGMLDRLFQVFFYFLYFYISRVMLLVDG